VQNERRGKGSFYKMKLWLRRTCAECRKGKGKLSQNETSAQANLCRIREEEREAFAKSNIGQGQPVQNEKMGQGSF
jgi:hypothetical protein